ncbi:hypothetical protein GP486_002932 [Trichoglossum hirsutum]|uniref:Dihydroorotate dehydrogenase (quinone), mitochondrial n=1 Tax=Trichoglossum hirsutum TaxID=265104 RepID=A0A9P8LE23_9PEZI|nr:hypothetical protein GP486_002932 [Trichoglossum hirsutum]
MLAAHGTTSVPTARALSFRALRSARPPSFPHQSFPTPQPGRRSALAPPPGLQFQASVSTAATAGRSPALRRLKNLLYGTSLAAFLGLGWFYATDTRAGVHEWLVFPALRWWYCDPEEAHDFGMRALKALWELGLNPRERGDMNGGILEVEVFSQTLVNPIAISAGVDKRAQAPTPLLALGPAIVEVGATTPLPQYGNPKPRLFRLPSQKALINRYGFNSEGADVVAMRLRKRVRQFAYAIGFGADDEAERKVLDGEAGVPPGSLMPARLMAVQIAKNKWTPESDIEAVKRDYVYCVQQLGKYADIIVVNVSSPNTPGLRTLQRVEPLTKILKGVVDAAVEVPRRTKPRVMVKVSPDEDGDEQLRGICKAVRESGIDGVIVANTTNRRPDPLPKGYVLPHEETALLSELGGYSGPQLFEKTLSLVQRYRKLLDEDPPRKNGDEPSANRDTSSPSTITPTETTTPRDHHDNNNPEKKEQQTLALKDDHHDHHRHRKVIFASGGITTGKQALEVLNAGASIAMVNTALVYGGAGTITRIKREMRDEMARGT